MKIDDVAKEMGPEFEEVGYQGMYQALKAILFQNGIFLSMATHKDGDKTFVLRNVKEGEELAPSYLFVKHKDILEKEKSRGKGREKDRDGREKKEENERLKRDEEKEKEMQEKITMRNEIKKLKEILRGRLGRKSCMIEIFQFNWNTLTWRMVKRSSARTYLKLLEVVMDNTSNTENRYRIELTPLYQLEDRKKTDDEIERENGQKKKDGVKKGEIADIHGVCVTDLAEISSTLEELKGSENEKIEEKAYKGLECPRCGGKNIKTWLTVQVIKTRSGDRRLRHRCVDCNETFTDEDIGIRQ